MSAPSPAITAKYEIKEMIAGSQCIVYKALDKGLNRYVAIKTPDAKVLASEELLASFVEEGQKLASIDNVGVLPVLHFYDVGEIDQTCYIITPWMDCTLADILKREDLSFDAGLNIMSKVLHGIRALHAAGIIHRDIKPDNIFVSKDASLVKIGDLGISSKLGEDSTLTEDAYTPKYLAPETFNQENSIDRRSDIFSAGVMAYELFLGKAQFEKVFAQIYQAKDINTQNSRWMNWNLDAKRVAPKLSDVSAKIPSDISDAVMKMMSKSPDDRQTDIDEVLNDFSAHINVPATNSFDILPTDDLGSDTQKRWTAKKVIMVVGAILLSFGISAAIIMSSLSRGKEEADAAGIKMKQARELAISINANEEYGKSTFDLGEVPRAEGIAFYESGSYKKSRSEFDKATEKFLVSIENQKTGIIQKMLDQIRSDKNAVKGLGGDTLDSYIAANKQLMSYQGNAEQTSFDDALPVLEQVKDKFSVAHLEARSIAALGVVVKAKKMLALYGIDDQFYPQLAPLFEKINKGAQALTAKDFSGALKMFNEAKQEINVAGQVEIEAIVGSTAEEKEQAYILCTENINECKRDWYSERNMTVKYAPFVVDQYEVSNSQFASFVQDTDYVTVAEKTGYSYYWTDFGSIPKDGLNWRNFDDVEENYTLKPDHPVVHIAQADAAEYCTWSGKRLPTEFEWEFAARSYMGRIFPWGNEWAGDKINWGGGGLDSTARVGEHAESASLTDIYDLSGNVWEWTSSIENDKGIMKGGSWVEKNPANMRGAARRTQDPQVSHSDDGFRCVKDVDSWLSN